MECSLKKFKDMCSVGAQNFNNISSFKKVHWYCTACISHQAVRLCFIAALFVAVKLHNCMRIVAGFCVKRYNYNALQVVVTFEAVISYIFLKASVIAILLKRVQFIFFRIINSFRVFDGWFTISFKRNQSKI